MGFPPERAWCDRSRLSAGAGLLRPESAFRRSGLPHKSEVCCELGFVAPSLAACEGALDGRPDSCRRAACAAADSGCSRARLPLAQEGERRVARMTPHPPSSLRRRRGGSAQPPEPWRWARDELKLAKAPLPGAPNVVVCKSTAGWRSAPALTQRVSTRGLTRVSSISVEEHEEHSRLRVVRTAGA